MILLLYSKERIKYTPICLPWSQTTFIRGKEEILLMVVFENKSIHILFLLAVEKIIQFEKIV